MGSPGGTVVSEFEHHSRYKCHFLTNTFQKGIHPLIPSYDLNITPTVDKDGFCIK